jgi:mobilome CxxCx(11)CxxC protein
MDPTKVGRSDARERALCTYAAAHFFENRANLLGRQLKIVFAACAIIPILVILLLLIMGPDIASLSWLVILLAVIQIALCALAFGMKWDERLALATEAKIGNFALVDRYEKMAKSSAPPEENQAQFDFLDKEYQARLAQRNKLRVTDDEKRMGTCAALRHYRWPCSGCSKVPMTMSPSDCPECGKFSKRKVII